MKTLYNQTWYRPREIARLGLIKNSKGNTEAGNYHYVIMLIQTGRLKAKNYGRNPLRPRYLVPENEIQRYHNTVTKV